MVEISKHTMGFIWLYKPTKIGGGALPTQLHRQTCGPVIQVYNCKYPYIIHGASGDVVADDIADNLKH
jgi:hypothetical protein